MLSDNQRVVVTGLGAVTPVGNDVPTMWANLLAGKSGAGPITTFDASEFRCQIAAEVKGFDPNIYFSRKDVRHADRYTQFATAAAVQAVEDACLRFEDEDPRRIGVIIGSGVGGIQTLMEQNEVLRSKGPRRVSVFLVPSMLVNTASGHVAIRFGLRGRNVAVVSACASGADAIGSAFETIRRGDADAMITGGAEAPMVEIAVAGFENMTALTTHNEEPERASRPFDARRDGFLIGEGAGMLVLESLAHARARGARIYGEVLGYGNSEDAHHITAPREDGLGASEAIAMAMQHAGIPPEAIDYVNAHGTSTPLNDSSETKAIKRFFGEHAYRLAISSTKSMMGHLLGAAGAVEAIVCMKVLNEGIIPPTINYEFPDPACDLDYVPNIARQADVRAILSNSFGFGGHNAALVLARLDD